MIEMALPLDCEEGAERTNTCYGNSAMCLAHVLPHVVDMRSFPVDGAWGPFEDAVLFEKRARLLVRVRRAATSLRSRPEEYVRPVLFKGALV